VTTATLLEVTSAISHSDRGGDSRREETATSAALLGVTSATLPEVTSAIPHSDRGRSFSSSRSHLIVPSAIENACRVGVCGTMDMSLCHPLNLACPQADSLGYNTTFSSMLV